MPMFPVHRPRIGLSFSAQALSVVELQRPWVGRRRLRRTHDRPLPPGLICPSPRELNISDVERLSREVREAVEAASCLAVAVSLPDDCAQIGLFDFESLPERRAECEAILRLRFQQEFQVPMEGTRLAYRVFNPAQAQGRVGSDSPTSIRVLAAAIRDTILAQYEQACEAAGHLPVSVGFCCLQLFDLWQPVLRQADELFLVHRNKERLAFLAVRHGHPVFFRLTPCRQVVGGLMQDLLSTLQFYDDRHPRGTSDARAVPVPLFLLADEGGPESGAPDAESSGAEQSVLSPMGIQPWHVEIIRPGWEGLPVSCEQSTPSFAGLSALAGVMTS